jgi:hypothetical protein
VADGVGTVGGQDDANGGSPQIGMDGGGDPHMGADGGDGRQQQCKNLVAAARNRRQKLNNTKVIFSFHLGHNLFRRREQFYMFLCVSTVCPGNLSLTLLHLKQISFYVLAL